MQVLINQCYLSLTNDGQQIKSDFEQLSHRRYGTGIYRELVLTDKSAHLPADTINCTTMKENLNSVKDADNHENWSYLSLLWVNSYNSQY